MIILYGKYKLYNFFILYTNIKHSLIHMSIQYSYDNIKGNLQDLYINYIPQEERYSNVEHFTIPQHLKDPIAIREIDQRFKSDPNVRPVIKNIVVPSEVISVVDKFDLEPSLLNTDEKNLRKKYLEILLTQMNDMYITQKTHMIDNSHWTHSLSPEEKRIVSENADSFQMLTARIIKLLIKELEPTKCPKCPKCPTVSRNKNKETFMNLSSDCIEPRTLILCAIIIGVLYYYFKNNTI